jgi:hypothetical protein
MINAVGKRVDGMSFFILSLLSSKIIGIVGFNHSARFFYNIKIEY